MYQPLRNPAAQLIKNNYDQTPGWVIATVVTADHRNLSAEMLEASLAVATPEADPGCDEAQQAVSPP